MPRTRQISDSHIFEITRRLLSAGGDRAVTFAAVAKKSGLSGPSLVQRYQSRESMLLQAQLAGWEALEALTEAAIQRAPSSAKGISALLKAIAPDDLALPPTDLAVLVSYIDDQALRSRALAWRGRLVAAIAERLGSKDREGAEIIFAAWQGRILWSGAGVEGFRLRDLQKRLAKS